ncbi:MAG TPA: hypothetical protein VNW46_10300 [Gemmatimonadaceae bacterium]|jgi:hypothetical protein|nr:hypothetical protein [Gemmatimonadaceae bacterium]
MGTTGTGPGAQRRAEFVGQLRYLSIHLQEYVAALPAKSLPPRGRVPWSVDELATLRALAHELATGERDADRAAGALDAIAALFAREPGSVADGDQLADYLAQRAIVIDTLPRLQRVSDTAPAPPEPRPASPRPSLWGWLTRLRS